MTFTNIFSCGKKKNYNICYRKLMSTFFTKFLIIEMFDSSNIR